jgi:N,N'-diacetyllegionaminate synthase
VRSFPRVVEIGKRRIGEGERCYVIAEAGVNHNGNVELARKLVMAAASAGADAVKFQTFRTEALASSRAAKVAYQKETTRVDESQQAMLKRLELPDSAFAELMAIAGNLGIEFLSTPFDPESVCHLLDLGVPAIKVSSGDLTNEPLLRQIAESGKPILLSTGMAYLGEVEKALETIEQAGSSAVILLHCVSSYPTDPEAVNLRAMDTMNRAFCVPVGFSDHTLGVEVAVAAVARGAQVLEKHLTLDCSLPGPDHRASLDPGTFAAMVRAVRNVEAALGHGRKLPHTTEAEARDLVRKSVVAVRPIAAGAVISEGDVGLRRPGTGLPPHDYGFVVGRRARHEIAADTPITLEDLA